MKMTEFLTRRIPRICTFFFIILLLGWTDPIQVHAFANPLSGKATPHQSPIPSKLEQQVKEWTATLAKQKPFSGWQTIDPQIEALGPGTHSWLVLFTKEGKDVGYMIVHAVTDGSFQLGEYGLGPYSLFSQQLLKRSLIDNGLLTANHSESMTAAKHYLHPFAAVWEVTIGEDHYWLDAKTAELLPLDVMAWQQLLTESYDSIKNKTKEISLIETFVLNETFDAYERLPWLTKEAPFPAWNAKKLQSRLKNKQHLRYVTEPFGDKMLYAIPIVGYQHWSNGRIDLALNMEGIRMIPIDDLLGKGSFYR